MDIRENEYGEQFNYDELLDWLYGLANAELTEIIIDCDRILTSRGDICD